MKRDKNSLNRTSVELKQPDIDFYGYQAVTLNRTSVELKRLQFDGA